MGRKLAGIAELLERRIAEELAVEADMASMITGFRRTTAEVSAAMNMTAARARTLVGHAEALNTRLPAVGALLAAGEVDFDTVELVLARTELVGEDLVTQVDASVAEQIRRWKTWSRAQVIIAVDQAVTLVDADAAKQRRVAAYDDRSVTVTTGLDGMAVVRIKISATEGAATDAQLSALAKAVCPGDPRSLKQRRADAFVAMKDGHILTCRCANPDCSMRMGGLADPADAVGDAAEPGTAATPATPETPATPAAPVPPAFRPGPQVVVNVIASADTVNGASEAPGYLCGFGVIDAALVRELAREATRRLVEHPGFDPGQALTYRPSAALARYIRCRDLTCRFPGCTVPAARCDIDHTEPFNHDDPASGGLTV
ncbi:HNH endonuclease, partial [Mycobacterium sp. ITM-2017-0098]